MSNIKPIETSYAGCRFRSRLEARWAVFFDCMGIEWQYEPQGYVIDGTPYLPDFWLPNVECWAEVKGRFGEGQFDVIRKAAVGGLPGSPDATEESSPPRILLLGNVPDSTDKCATSFWLIRPSCPNATTIAAARRMFAFISLPFVVELGPEVFDLDSIDPNMLLVADTISRFKSSQSVRVALGAARTARFEHGEQHKRFRRIDEFMGIPDAFTIVREVSQPAVDPSNETAGQNA